MRRCVERIEHRHADSVDTLRTDADRQDSLSLNPTRATRLGVDIAVHLLSVYELAGAPDHGGAAFHRCAPAVAIAAEP